VGSFYKGAHGLTYRALANILAEIASDQPMHFAQDASKFLGMSPEYITGLLRGWENAVQQKRELAWEPVLDLCERSLELPPSVRSEDLASTDEDFANEWRTLQLAVASLLTVGVEPERAMIPVMLAIPTLLRMTRNSGHRQNQHHEHSMLYAEWHFVG